jgi:hypothetical protein
MQQELMTAKLKTVKYKRRTTALSPVTFTVDTECGTIEITARHLTYHENAALDFDLIGLVPEEWEPKRKLLRERVLKLARVTLSVNTGDPDDPDLASGDFEHFYSLPGNENLAYLGWYEYGRAVDGRVSKSGSQVRGDSHDESGAAAGPGDPATDAHVLAVRGAASAGTGPEATVQARSDSGGV